MSINQQKINNYFTSTKIKDNIHITVLPPEIINVEIIKYLDDTSLCNLIQTSKEIYNLIDPLVIYNRKFDKYTSLTVEDLIRCNCIHGIDFLIENIFINENVFMHTFTNIIVSYGHLNLILHLDYKYNFINEYRNEIYGEIINNNGPRRYDVFEYLVKRANRDHFEVLLHRIFINTKHVMYNNANEINDLHEALDLMIEVNAKFNINLIKFALDHINRVMFKELISRGCRFTDADVIEYLDKIILVRYNERNVIKDIFCTMLNCGGKRMIMNVMKKITDPESMYILFYLIETCLDKSGFTKEECVSWINYFCSKTEYQHLKEKFDELLRRYQLIDNLRNMYTFKDKPFGGVTYNLVSPRLYYQN